MANWVAGWNAKVRINGGVYAAASYRARDTATDQDVSNTEGIVGNRVIASAAGANGVIVPYAESRMSGLQHMEAEVRQATFDLAANPFVDAPELPNVFSTGIGVSTGNFISLYIYVGFVGSVAWFSPSFLVLEASMDMDIQRLQPVSFNGKSDGYYEVPNP